MRYPTWLIATLAILMGCLSGCMRCTSGDTPTLEKIKKLKRVRIGYANEAPYAYYDVFSGRLTGEAPEIARHILKEMGVEEVEGVLTEFGSMIPGLKARRFDLIAAGMYITPERCKEVLFSDPTYGIGDMLIVKEGNPHNLHSLADVAAKPQVKISTVAGALEYDHAMQAGVKKSQISVYPDAPSALEGVLAGRVDGYVATSLTAKELLKKEGEQRLQLTIPFTDLKTPDGTAMRGYGAFAFRKADKDFRDAFNEQLHKFIGSQEHLDLVSPFGFGVTEIPPDNVSAEVLCQPVASPSSN